MEKPFSTAENPVGILGKAVNDFLTHYGIKSIYVRTVSRFGSTQFVRLKRAN